MNETAASPAREEAASQYLLYIEQMAAQLDAAMQAIARNALPDFEESLARQEILCGQLTALSPEIASLGHEAYSADEKPFAHRIREANGRLQELNRRYAALIRHSGQSLGLLSSLCRSYAGHFPQAAAAETNHQTWSCEI